MSIKFLRVLPVTLAMLSLGLSVIALPQVAIAEPSLDQTLDSVDRNTFDRPGPTFDALEGEKSAAPVASTTPKGQVTSILQLSDVQPTDWAYQALQSLVERYGCIAGYPDGSFRGNRAATRFEMAAALNACLEAIDTRFATKEDLETAKQLQQEYATELVALEGRVKALEARTAILEEQQFAPTVKLIGQASFWIAGLEGGDGDRNNLVLQDRVALNFVTSFTGKDLLITGLLAGVGGFLTSGLGTGFDIAPINVGGIPVPSGEGTLSSQFGAIGNNTFYLFNLQYQYPVNKRLQLIVNGNFGVLNYYAPTLNPYLDDNDGGNGAISTFGQRNPIYRLGNGPGIGFNYKLLDQLTLTGVYLGDFIDSTEAVGPNGGFIGGTYSALAQLTWKPTKNFGIATTYIRSFFTPGRFGFSNNQLYLTGTAVANTLAGQSRLTLGIDFIPPATNVNSYGLEFTYQPLRQMAISGWFGASYPDLVNAGDGEIFTYALTFAFPDLGRKGNLGALIIGAEPYLTRYNGGNPQPFATDIPWHIEASYRYQVTPAISLTPGVIWLTAPNQDEANPDDVIFTVRSTFTF